MGLHIHQGAVRSIYIDKFNEVNSEKILTGSTDNTMQLWNLYTGNNLTFSVKQGWNIQDCLIWKRGVACSADKYLKVWDCESKPMAQEVKAHCAGITNFNILDKIGEQKLAISGSFDDTIKI